jgi:hypothetical protein
MRNNRQLIEKTAFFETFSIDNQDEGRGFNMHLWNIRILIMRWRICAYLPYIGAVKGGAR